MKSLPSRVCLVIGGMLLILVAVLIISPNRRVALSRQTDPKSGAIRSHRVPRPTIVRDRQLSTPTDAHAESVAKMAKIAEERTEALREAGMLGKKNAPNHLLLGEQGRLTKQAIGDAGLDEHEINAVQEVFDTAWEQVSKTLSASARLDRNETDPTSGVYVFEIPSLDDGGASIIKDIEQKIEDIVGGGSADRLINAFDSNNCLCGFGKYDVRIELHYPTEYSLQTTAHYSFTYPATSQVIRRGSVTKDRFYRLFGSIVDHLDHQAEQE